jgi:hypothetical protein
VEKTNWESNPWPHGSNNNACWWARYCSICIFHHFQWFPIFAWPSAALYDSDNVVGCVSNHWQFTRCHSGHFWPFPMFLWNFQCLLAYIWLIDTSMYYLCIPHTIVYLFDVFQIVSDFIYLWTYWYSDVSIIYSCGWLYYYYRFGLWSLRTISSIWFLRRHFDLSKVIFTYIYIALSFYTKITLYCIPRTFVRLCIALIRLHSPSFTGLISRTWTSIHFVWPCSFNYSLFSLTFYWFCSDLARSFVIYIAH